MLKKLFTKKLLKIIIIFFIGVIFLLIIIFGYNAFFAHKVYPGVYLNNKPVLNYSYSDVYNFLEEQSKIFHQQGINYKFGDKVVNIGSTINSLNDPDLSYSILEFDNLATAQKIFAVGRDKDYKNNFLKQLEILFIKPQKIEWQYNIDREKWRNILENNFKDFETEFKVPAINFVNDEIIISESQDGKKFDYDLILEQTENNINNFSFAPLDLELKEVKPNVNLMEANQQIDKIKEIAKLESLTLNYNQKFWKINSSIFKDWLVLKRNFQNEIIVSFDFDKYQKYLEEYIILDINQESKNARFEIKNGRVIEFQGSQDGFQVNLEETLNSIEVAMNNLETEIDLAVDVIKADVQTENINDLGIKEIIGTGESDFRGSPPNRVHNITTGAKILNGILIPVGSEFETIESLKPVNAENGYLPELVIKGNETIPEYGGGLCQIGTTIYRAALRSGLKITQRRPHSYRVSYYEPAGMDATIYDPWPDMKFVNDTGNYILIQSQIVGTKLYFNFWGTKDGRQISVSDPVIYNIVGSGPTKEIETDKLEPGQRKCTESAHAGADAYFDYKVEYINGEVFEERIYSHYVPWQAVCLIGVEKVIEENLENPDLENPEENGENPGNLESNNIEE